MCVEQKLKELILSRYRSIREFILEIDMPYTTIDSMFKRGIGNSSVGNVIKICKALGISADALADGEIVPVKHQNDSKDLNDIVEETKLYLSTNNLTLDGIHIDKNNIDPVINALEISMEMVRKKVNK